MAAEQIKGRYSIQSDIYAFGVVAYFLVTNGAHPYGDNRFSDQIEKAVLSNVKFPSITERGSAPWPDIESVISKCTMPKELMRPTSAELVQIFKSFDFQSMRRCDKLADGLPESFLVNCAITSKASKESMRSV